MEREDEFAELGGPDQFFPLIRKWLCLAKKRVQNTKTESPKDMLVGFILKKN